MLHGAPSTRSRCENVDCEQFSLHVVRFYAVEKEKEREGKEVRENKGALKSIQISFSLSYISRCTRSHFLTCQRESLARFHNNSTRKLICSGAVLLARNFSFLRSIANVFENRWIRKKRKEKTFSSLIQSSAEHCCTFRTACATNLFHIRTSNWLLNL